MDLTEQIVYSMRWQPTKITFFIKKKQTTKIRTKQVYPNSPTFRNITKSNVCKVTNSKLNAKLIFCLIIHSEESLQIKILDFYAKTSFSLADSSVSESISIATGFGIGDQMALRNSASNTSIHGSISSATLTLRSSMTDIGSAVSASDRRRRSSGDNLLEDRVDHRRASSVLKSDGFKQVEIFEVDVSVLACWNQMLLD